MFGALAVRHLFNADTFVVGLALVEAFDDDFQSQVSNSVWLRVHSSAVLWMHTQSRQRYFSSLTWEPIFDTIGHCLADETIVHGGGLHLHGGGLLLGRNCGLDKEHPSSQRKQLPANPLPPSL